MRNQHSDLKMKKLNGFPTNTQPSFILEARYQRMGFSCGTSNENKHYTKLRPHCSGKSITQENERNQTPMHMDDNFFKQLS